MPGAHVPRAHARGDHCAAQQPRGLARGDHCAAQQLVTESARACIYCTNLAVPVDLPVFFNLGDVTRSVQSRAISN